jgi:hypothetical protein
VYVRPRACGEPAAQQVGVEVEPGSGNSSSAGSSSLTVRFGEQSKSIQCDGAFHATDSQQHVYAAVAPRIIEAVVGKAISACVFAYVREAHTRTYTCTRHGSSVQ